MKPNVHIVSLSLSPPLSRVMTYTMSYPTSSVSCLIHKGRSLGRNLKALSSESEVEVCFYHSPPSHPPSLPLSYLLTIPIYFLSSFSPPLFPLLPLPPPPPPSRPPRFLFSFIQKDKQCESLVEKLCHRFRTTRYGCMSV